MNTKAANRIQEISLEKNIYDEVTDIFDMSKVRIFDKEIGMKKMWDVYTLLCCSLSIITSFH